MVNTLEQPGELTDADRTLEIISAMYAAVPPGLSSLDEVTRHDLQSWTRQPLPRTNTPGSSRSAGGA